MIKTHLLSFLNIKTYHSYFCEEKNMNGLQTGAESSPSSTVQPHPPLSRYQGASRSAVLAHKTHPGVGARPGHRRHGKAHRSAEASHDAEAKTTAARGGKPWKMAKEVETMINHIYSYLPIFTHIYHIFNHIYPYLPIFTHIYPYLLIFTHIYQYLSYIDPYLSYLPIFTHIYPLSNLIYP